MNEFNNRFIYNLMCKTISIPQSNCQIENENLRQTRAIDNKLNLKKTNSTGYTSFAGINRAMVSIIIDLHFQIYIVTLDDL